MAKIEYTTAVYVAAYAEHGQVHIVTEIGKHGGVVEEAHLFMEGYTRHEISAGGVGQEEQEYRDSSKVMEQGEHGEDNDPRMEFTLGHLMRQGGVEMLWQKTRA